MAWTLTEDPGEYVAAAGVFVRSHPVQHTIQLSVMSRAALAAGAQDVVLFTDLANPTSNAVYQRLGYRAVEDRVVLGFGG